MIDYILFEKYANGLNVLLVDDDNSIKEEMKDLLSEIYNFVEVAGDGDIAYKKYEEFYKENGKYFDIVISDVSMPNMNGIKLTELIYKLNANQEIIIISAYSNPQDLIEFINLGVSQFVSKPIEINGFINILYNISKKLSDENEKVAVAQDKTKIVLTNNMIWDKENKKLTKDDYVYKLTKKEMLLIDLLLTVCDKTYDVDVIISHLWDENEEMQGDIKNLKNVISRLRKKIPELVIENVYGLGYKIIYCKEKS